MGNAGGGTGKIEAAGAPQSGTLRHIGDPSPGRASGVG